MASSASAAHPPQASLWTRSGVSGGCADLKRCGTIRSESRSVGSSLRVATNVGGA
jgi:hypothetical protein